MDYERRTKVGTSHEGQFTYWLDTTDRYVYQRRESDGLWIGWYCSQSSWEAGLGKAKWITPLTEVTA